MFDEDVTKKSWKHSELKLKKSLFIYLFNKQKKARIKKKRLAIKLRESLYLQYVYMRRVGKWFRCAHILVLKKLKFLSKIIQKVFIQIRCV